MLTDLKHYWKNAHEKIEKIQDVLLSQEELEKHSREVAVFHSTSDKMKSTKSLLHRLDSHYRTISAVYQEVNGYTKKQEEISPASQWLLDNFYKIEEQVKDIRLNIRRERFLKLRVLSEGHLVGYPRVYAIALELVSHTDGRLDEEVIKSFIRAYQSQQVLTIAEIWSLSLMLRIALIEKIRLLCEKIRKTEGSWRQAEALLNCEDDEVLNAIKDIFDASEKVNYSFIEHFLKAIRRQAYDKENLIKYIEERLKEHNKTLEYVIESEHQRQAARKVSMGNTIISLNLIGVLDWNEFFEELSVVEHILREETSGIYQQMDFESRDYYRGQIEKISHRYHISETKIAKAAVKCADQEAESPQKYSHVGYYLIDQGKQILFDELEIKDKPRYRKPASLSVYLFPICSITIGFTFFFMIYTYISAKNMAILWGLAAGLIALIPISEIAVMLTNRIVTKTIPPDFIPRYDFKEAIPLAFRTLVVIPTLLPDKGRVIDLLEQLEVYYLSNKKENIVFALAGDFKDSIQAEEPSDQEIIDEALKRVRMLNEKYGSEIFFFFHRHRQYAEGQERWMGWERKRGALLELNHLLAGEKATSYSIMSGNPNDGGPIKYVITLDADTRLPIDTAKKLIGMMAHPLNEPIIDQERRIVGEGYGLIQPRIDVSIESSNATVFAQIYAGQGGIDPYTTANSDVYQDLYQEGIFTGKGIYDLTIFNKVLTDAIPDNLVLSHDLLEGSYIRTALASDLELIDDYPAKYCSYMMRLHRWVRGDWQLLQWLSARIRNREGKIVSNPLSALSKWKILDNLRRSLIPLGLLLTFSIGATLIPGNRLLWLALGTVTLLLPFMINLVDSIRIKINAQRYGLWGNFFQESIRTFYLAAFQLIFLPYQAYMMADAIIRTLFRLYRSNKNLLEWVTLADSEKKLKNDLISYIRRMAAIYPIILLLFVLMINGRLVYTITITALWIISPWAAYRISSERVKNIAALEEGDEMILKRITRKTWAYYEDLVGEEDNFLPPDNYQVYPPRGAARRTSPTNIGFYLLSVLSARDFGYITTARMLKRIQETISTIEKMETWRGHLYNWYDTQTLEVLRPQYVSTVDSGNFISYLAVTREGIKEYLQRPIIDERMIEGLRDTVSIEEDNNQLEMFILQEKIKEEKITLRQYASLINELINNQNHEIKGKERFSEQLMLMKKEMEYFFPSIVYQAKGNNPGEEFTFMNESWPKERIPSLMELEKIYESLLYQLNQKQEGNQALKETLSSYKQNVAQTVGQANDLIQRIDRIIAAADFKSLYDKKRQLLSIGYHAEEGKLTNAYYDLLASEIRTTSYFAISKGDIPKKHWYKLGRIFSVTDGSRALVSWTGTMFEYFMPFLTMKNYGRTLLDETYHTVIKAHQNYGRRRNVPWGISESGYYGFDMLLNYQYKAFGVPDIGLKRGLIDEIVVSPYSTLLALPLSPRESMENIRRFLEDDMEGIYGFYEAVDYTPERLNEKTKKKIVQSFMAHHLGMSIVSLNNYFNDYIMQKRFHRDPVVRAGETLLQERPPIRSIITKELKETPAENYLQDGNLIGAVRRYGLPEALPPRCHILSNGHYSVLLTEGGSGYSAKDDLQLTRWRQDPILGRFGTFIFINNLKANRIWSTTYEPLRDDPDGYQVIFGQDKAEYHRTDENISTHTEIIVSAEDPVEIRKVTITNHGTEEELLQITSYFETVMANQSSDIAHPAFSNLFVRTELLTEYDTLVASRRPRGHNQTTKWLFHCMKVEGNVQGGLQYETNRNHFIGRGKSIDRADAHKHPLKNYTGIAIDPIMSLRRTIKIKGGESAVIIYATGCEEARENLMELIKKYQDTSAVQRAAELALTRSQVELTYLNFRPQEIEIFSEAMPYLIYLNPGRRVYEEILKQNRKGQSGLWAYGISGDIPILLLTIKKIEDIDVLKEILRAHEYWRTKGLKVDLVILNEDESSYLQPLQQLINEVVYSSNERHLLNQPGGIFIRDANVVPEEDKVLFYAVARLIIKAELGPLRKQLTNIPREIALPPEKSFNGSNLKFLCPDIPIDVAFYNEYGGFSKDGKEYIIKLRDGMQTPAPWSNVVANKDFGFIVTESGSGFTWAENSRENKITPWSNDPVSDPPGEMIYIQDGETGEVWSVTPLPIRERGSYVIKHGMGYSTFLHNSHGIEQQLQMFVPAEDPIKINYITLKNSSSMKRRLRLTYYITPVIGVSDEMTRQYIMTNKSSEGGITITNSFQSDFPGRVTLMDTSENITSFTGDRQAFFGLTGDIALPEGLKREKLNNQVGAGLDPCGAIQCEVELDSGEQRELVFLMGQVKEERAVKSLTAHYKSIENCKTALREVGKLWQEYLHKIQVKTPDLSMDFMLNGWLLYQTIACRLWARSAFYQSGGAYGYRDQLQDAMNVMYPYPEAIKRQILLHCEHQFIEGDVQHWWHPGAGEKGIRTRFSDDLLWLPYATAEYFHHTQDRELLYQERYFLEEEPLQEGEDERYGIPRISQEKASVYDHCIRAIERSLRYGIHGIPLMGSGDWNDGMSTVGNKGRGESIWLGWFLYKILKSFAPICSLMKESDRAERYIKIAEEIAQNIEKNGWDGEWYLRAFYDDGSPLGSSQNTECIIDSLGQSWSIISGGGDLQRSKAAMRAVEDYLIKKEEGLILLFTPPFDDSDQEPGYIKGYVPGVRENGGQYTHAATWVIKAFAMAAEGDQAWNLYHMINPINHTRTPFECSVYKVEPYVIAADVYAVSPHIGRGGWTWYTGAAGWMYSVGMGDILGLRKEGNALYFEPCIPKDWAEYEIKYKHGNALYHILVKNPNGVNRHVRELSIDGIRLQGKKIELTDDQKNHYIEVILGD